MKELFFYFKKNKALTFTAAILFLAIFIQTGYVTKLKTALTDTRNARYQKAFFDLSSSLSNIDLSLKKALITNDPQYLSYTAGEIEKEAGIARECLGDLPKKDINLMNSQNFLSQISDYINFLIKKDTDGNGLNENDKAILKKLSSYADILSKEILDMENKFLSYELDFNSVIAAASDDNTANSYFENIEKQFKDYPSFAYNGEYSVLPINSSYFKNEPEISKETAKKNALAFLDFISPKELDDSTDSVFGTEVYGFNKDNQIYIDVTKKGGYILSFLNSREINEENISIETAIKKAELFLKSKGFEGFSPDFYEKENFTLAVSFFNNKNGITLYPEMIKINVALDNGEITGANFKDYLENKKERTDLIPLISAEDVKFKIGEEAEIKTERLCIIPTYKENEVLTYEFYLKANNQDYLYYINAKTGYTEKIFMIIKDKNKIIAI